MAKKQTLIDFHFVQVNRSVTKALDDDEKEIVKYMDNKGQEHKIITAVSHNLDTSIAERKKVYSDERPMTVPLL